MEQKEEENGIWAERRLLQGPSEDPSAVTQNFTGLTGNGLCSAVRGDSFQEPPPFLPLAIAQGAENNFSLTIKHPNLSRITTRWINRPRFQTTREKPFQRKSEAESCPASARQSLLPASASLLRAQVMESFTHTPRVSLHGAEPCLCEAGNGLLQDWAWFELGNPALGAKGY